jgi:hypothetical protein
MLLTSNCRLLHFGSMLLFIFSLDGSYATPHLWRVYQSTNSQAGTYRCPSFCSTSLPSLSRLLVSSWQPYHDSPLKMFSGDLTFTWRVSVCSYCSLSYFLSRCGNCSKCQRNRRGIKQLVIVSGYYMLFFCLYPFGLSFAWSSTREGSVPRSRGKRFTFIVLTLSLCSLHWSSSIFSTLEGVCKGRD